MLLYSNTEYRIQVVRVLLYFLSTGIVLLCEVGYGVQYAYGMAQIEDHPP